METGFNRGAESRIPKRKLFEKWQHLSKSQMSTNMQCKVWDSNSCNIVLKQVLHPCPTLLPYTIVTGLRLLIENKDTLLLLMTYQFLTSGVLLPLTVYYLIMHKYPLMKGIQLYHANHLTLCDTKWSLPLTRCLTHIIWIIIIQKSKRPIINGDTNNAHVVCI